ncbi:MAG: hypothetical protein ABEK29_08400, partial [Bradymonadaceae bacterium]
DGVLAAVDRIRDGSGGARAERAGDGERREDDADEALQVFYPQMRKRPESMAEMLQNLDFHLGEPLEIVVVGPAVLDPAQGPV